jgi:hypothetical protein
VSSAGANLANIVAMFSVDMVGAGSGLGLNLYGANNPQAAWLAELMNGAKAAQGLSYSVQSGNSLGQSDDACFEQSGVAAVLASSIGPHGNYHVPEDNIDKIQIKDLESSAKLLWAALKPLALGQEKLYSQP